MTATIKITFENSGGELDSREVEAPVDVRGAIEEMLHGVDEMFPGDKIIISAIGTEA